MILPAARRRPPRRDRPRRCRCGRRRPRSRPAMRVSLWTSAATPRAGAIGSNRLGDRLQRVRVGRARGNDQRGDVAAGSALPTSGRRLQRVQSPGSHQAEATACGGRAMARSSRRSSRAPSCRGRGDSMPRPRDDYSANSRPCGHQAAFSSRASHLPVAARLFMRARCRKARCAAATFSGLPPQALIAAACSARP